MKSIDELGISPTPWHYEEPYKEGIASVHRPDSWNLFWSESAYTPDARLVAAAPELYECLRAAVEDKCWECPYKESCANENCYVHGWRDALAKAGGAE